MFEVLFTVANSIDFSPFIEMLLKNGLFACLFVWLLFDTKKESKAREEKLTNHIEKQGEALDKVTDTIERMDTRLSHIEENIRNSG